MPGEIFYAFYNLTILGNVDYIVKGLHADISRD